MLLQKLPNELVEQVIFWYLLEEWDHDVNVRQKTNYKTALGLMLTCRTLYELVLPILYEHVHIGYSRTKSLPALDSLDSYGENVRSLDVNNQSLALNYGKRVPVVLGKLPKLQKCTITCPVIRKNLFCMQTLVKLVVDQPCSLETSEISQLLSFPSLRFLEFKDLWTHWTSRVLYPDVVYPQNTVLQSLKVIQHDAGDGVDIPALKTIIAHCKNLKVLHCPLTLDPRTEQYTLSPSRILPTIIPVFATLVTLNLYDLLLDSKWGWERHDGNRLDLSVFTALRSLVTDSRLLLPPVHDLSPREGLYTLLPSSLEYLSLSFTMIQSKVFLHPGKQKLPFNLSSHASKVAKHVEGSFRWMTELADQKASCNSSLSTLTLTGYPFQFPGIQPKYGNISTPPHLQPTFSACAKVGIRIEFRMFLEELERTLQSYDL